MVGLQRGLVRLEEHRGEWIGEAETAMKKIRDVLVTFAELFPRLHVKPGSKALQCRWNCDLLRRRVGRCQR